MARQPTNGHGMTGEQLAKMAVLENNQGRMASDIKEIKDNQLAFHTEFTNLHVATQKQVEDLGKTILMAHAEQAGAIKTAKWMVGLVSATIGSAITAAASHFGIPTKLP